MSGLPTLSRLEALGRSGQIHGCVPGVAGRPFLAGLAVNLGNPKVIAFFLALLPTVVDLGTLTRLGFAELSLIVALIASSVLTAYARRLFASPGTVRLVNRGSGAIAAGTAVTSAIR